MAEKKAWIEKARSYWSQLSDMIDEATLKMVIERAANRKAIIEKQSLKQAVV